MPEKKIKNTSWLPGSTRGKFVLGALVLFGVLAAWLIGRGVSNFVASMTMIGLPGEPVMPVASVNNGIEGPAFTATATLLPPAVELPPAWDGKSRVNMLVMGIDARSPDVKAPLTDTMILFTLDPVSNTAGMLSIPRDLWVKVHGGEYNKINTAYSVGVNYNLPGGGPALAAKTVEDFLGVPIQYYAQIDFGAFIKFIDDIQGVKVTVEQPIDLAYIDTGDFKSLEPGRYTLSGSDALAYVRNRDGGNGDFDRAKRQQQVIMAVRDRLIDFNMMPSLIANSATLYQDLSAGIQTNLALDQSIRLALKVLEIDRDKITHYVIDAGYVNFGKSPTGLDILRPIPDKIRQLRDEVFFGIKPSLEETNEIVKAEQARVSIRNGSSTPGLETRTADFLMSQGINVTEVATSNYQTYTQITITGARPHTLRYLVSLLNVAPASRITYAYDPNSPWDIIVDLGDDWAHNNNLP